VQVNRINEVLERPVRFWTPYFLVFCDDLIEAIDQVT